MSLAEIDTIVLVMLENRSFDHLLGYLSLDTTRGRLAIEGLRSDSAWTASFTNLANGAESPLHQMPALPAVSDDPPHGRVSIDEQIHVAPKGPGPKLMGGFASSFLKTYPAVKMPVPVTGYHDAIDVPTFDFLAHQFCVCDHWFSAVPLGTQANRLMAMSGESLVVDNVTGLPNQPLVYDWLKQMRIDWRVYVSGGYAPFFMMMPRWAFPILESLALGNGHFHRFGQFSADWMSPRPFPSVVFIEPEYADAPMSHPNDDHPPAPIDRGQQFILDIYKVLISNPKRWAKSLLIVTYDEHGGFFDHVPPHPAEAKTGQFTFATTGPRVPALLVSPFVGAGQVFSDPLDHTSILQLLADRFAGGTYSPSVSKRQQGFGRIANAFTTKRSDIPAAPPAKAPAVTAAEAVPAIPRAPQTPNAAAMDAVVRQMAKEHPELIDQPAWREMKAYLETNAPPVPTHHDHI